MQRLRPRAHGGPIKCTGHHAVSSPIDRCAGSNCLLRNQPEDREADDGSGQEKEYVCDGGLATSVDEDCPGAPDRERVAVGGGAGGDDRPDPGGDFSCGAFPAASSRFKQTTGDALTSGLRRPRGGGPCRSPRALRLTRGSRFRSPSPANAPRRRAPRRELRRRCSARKNGFRDGPIRDPTARARGRRQQVAPSA